MRATSLCATVALAGCDEAPEASQDKAFGGTEKIQVDGRAVTVSCDGEPVGGRPVIILLHGGGDAPVVLVGHSLGGQIAARYAPDHPGPPT